MRQDFLPSEFDEIAQSVNYVHKKSHNEYSSSCPQCGGEVHKDGSFPDRFVLFVVGRYGTPLAFCRKCGYRWTPLKGKKPSQEDIELFRARQIEVEKARIEAAKRSIEMLQNDRMWEYFWSNNNTYSRTIFKEWGLAESWVNYLKLGLIPDYTVKNVDEAYHRPAFTIPVWFYGGIVQNIKIRIAEPKVPRDRYRNLYPMGQSFLFVPLYDAPLKGKCVLVEGEKKAAVMEQTLDDINYRVVGLQSKTPDPSLFNELKDFDVVYIWLDPDAKQHEIGKDGKPRESALEYVTRMMGRERARIVNCPVKSDDGIIRGMNPINFLNMATKAK